MKSYLDLLRDVRANGCARDDRTGIGTLSRFGAQLRFDLAQGFPLLTTKRLYVHAIIHELLWFLRGETNIASLQKEGVAIWDAWADERGELGPVYGRQWRAWEGAGGKCLDQIAWVIDEIRRNPNSRRLVVSAWNVAALPDMALWPCHALFQFHVMNGRLSCQLYQRSADIFLGLPFNIASYALLLTMVAQVTGYQPGELVHTLGDVHLYANHRTQADQQLSRTPRALPRQALDPAVCAIDDFRREHVRIDGYDPHPPIRAAVAV